MPYAADAAKAFNRQVRITVKALGAPADDDHRQAFVCECGCGEAAKLTLAEYDRQDGAWLAGHRPASV